MAKVMNVVFGVGIAIILFLVVILGIKTFYPEPTYDSYKCVYPQIAPCTPGTSATECAAQETAARADYEICSKKYQDARKIYDRNVFIISSLFGLIAIIIGFVIFFFSDFTNISAGVASSGLALMIYGFMVGWDGADDVLKFSVGLILAFVIIIFAVMANNKHRSE